MDGLLEIPGVGEKTARDLRLLGIDRIEDLNGKDPEELYAELCIIKGQQVDKCMLYVFRCAVYYATETTYDPSLLKWWNWKDRE